MNQNQGHAVQIQGLRKSYGAHEVLKGLDFSVEKGEIFALLGGNGAGKTTALECIEGLRPYDGGTVSVCGRIGIQLQSSSLPENIRPMEAVKLFAKWNRSRIDSDMLEALGLRDMAKKQYGSLSTGQKRRLHLALALVNHPDVLFLDEPTAGLDVEGKRALHSQIRNLREQGKAILLTSHDMGEVETLCDRIAVIKEGRILFCGTPAQLTDKTSREFSVSIRTREGVRTCRTESIGDTLLALLQDLKEREVPILDIQIDRGTLEQHFIDLTGGTEK